MSEPQASTELERIIKTAEVELRQIHPGLFSPEGFQRLTERINGYIGELTVESVKVAKRHQSDSVSPAYVDQASGFWKASPMAKSTRRNWWNVFGRGIHSRGGYDSDCAIFYTRSCAQCCLHRGGHARLHVPHHEGISLACISNFSNLLILRCAKGA